MATTITASVVTAFNVDGQNFYDITYPGPDLYQNHIASISKADPAVVTTSSAITVSTTGTVGTIAGSGPYTAIITGMSSTVGLQEGSIITATAGTGNLGVGTTHVTSVLGNKSVAISSSATQNAGTITDVTIAAPITIPAGFADGDAILITGVEGMTQLATAGHDGTNQFYANVLTDTTFALYTDSSLSTTVDSSGFTTATANTGSYQTFTGFTYESQGTRVPMVFPTIETNVGTDISIDAETGEITLAADITYQINVSCQPLTNPASFGGHFELWDEGSNAQVGQSIPINGTTLVATVTPSVETVYQVFAVAPEGQPWAPPAGIQFAAISIVAVSGYEVA